MCVGAILYIIYYNIYYIFIYILSTVTPYRISPKTTNFTNLQVYKFTPSRGSFFSGEPHLHAGGCHCCHGTDNQNDGNILNACRNGENAVPLHRKMNILIINGSPRKGGNTELLVEAFAKGAAAHHHVEIVSVRDVKVNPCLGCNACFKNNGICIQKDDMAVIYEKMSQADMLVIASPVYFYGISAQLKAVIDRFHNPIRDSFHIKKMALLLVGAATLPELFDAILTEYNLCLKFFNIEDAGKVLVRGVKDKGDIKNTNTLNEAYMLGLNI